MFRYLRPMCAIVAVAVSALLPALAHAEIYHYRAQGKSAHSSFFDIDSTGCLWRYTELSVTEGRIRNEPGLGAPLTWLDLHIFELDACGEYYPTGVELYTSTPIPADAFRINGALQSASVQVTVDVENRWMGTTEPATIEVTWIGDGDINRGHSNSQSTFPSGRSIWRSVGTFRTATPSGSVTLPSMTLTGGGFTYGRMESSQSATTTIFHNSPD